MAAKTGNSELVRYLVLSGADVDEYTKVQFTAAIIIIIITFNLLPENNTKHNKLN